MKIVVFWVVTPCRLVDTGVSEEFTSCIRAGGSKLL
jgi:hypothetical protein